MTLDTVTLDIVDASNEDRDLHYREIASGSVTEDSVQESVRRLRQLAEGSTDHLLLVDRSLRVLFANRDTAGRHPNQLVGHPIDQVLPQRGRDRAVACMHRVLQHGMGDRFEVEWQTPSGSTRFMEVRVGAVREQGNIVALTLNGSDTTSHVLAQRAVATQAKMIESMLEGVALVNGAGSIVITNPAFDNLFGYARGLLIGQSLTALAGGTSLDHSMESALTGGTGPWALEFDASRRDGTTVTVAGALSRLDDGGRTHLLLVLQDVSERKRLESAILEVVNREQYRIGNDLHDGLGQELTGIALLLRCLAGRLEVEHRAAVPDVEGITKLVSNAVESTRSLARGLSPVNLERGGLCDALAGLTMHARTVYGIRAYFSNRLPPHVALEAEVANHLYRIAQEAMTNAVKHGGAQTVRLHLGVAHRKLRMTIVDDGRGLPPEAERSSGMGLRIMRYRARIARGEVRVEDVEPNGVRVVCECPIDPSEVTAEPASQRAHRHQALRVAAKRGAGIGGRIATRSESARAALAHSKHRVKGEHK